MEMFKEPIQNIIHAIRTIFQHKRCSDVSAIMMVGGFSEADVVQYAVQKAFSDKDVFIPVDGSLSVLKGAVIYGHNPDVVSSRVCNFTYGSCVYFYGPSIAYLNLFVNGK
jgi:molecular chaperone DnaK (HSP70)